MGHSDPPRRPLDRRTFFIGTGLAAGSFMPLRGRAADAPSPPDAMAQLNAQVQRALRWSARPPADWVRPRPGVDHDVVVVGAGHSGLGISFGLRRKGISRVSLIDGAEPGGAGIWRHVARMHQLRSPKALPGPDLGNPELGFRAWYETLNGANAFEALERIPRLAWANYLAWYEQVTEANVRYRTRLVEIEPAGDVLRLHLQVDGAPRTETTRKVVLTSGFAGAGGAHIPEILRGIPAALWSHTHASFDYQVFAGKSVAVLGAGASAFDAAASALEHGAREAHLYSRRSFIDYPVPGVVGPIGPPGQPGIRGHANLIELAYDLPEEVRWRDHRSRENRTASVPADSLQRAVSLRNFHLHLDSPWTRATSRGGGVVAEVNGRKRRFDHVIAATGYRVDLAAQPELAAFHSSITRWGDQYRPPTGEEDATAAQFPYLGRSFEYLQRADANADFLRNIHCFNLAAALSYGILVGDIPSIAHHPRLVTAVARDLFLADLDIAQNQRFNDTPPPPPDPAPYQRALVRG
jgi:cation diffusion facilitator CzcD-associated flavoprotein CzcO